MIKIKNFTITQRFDLLDKNKYYLTIINSY